MRGFRLVTKHIAMNDEAISRKWRRIKRVQYTLGVNNIDIDGDDIDAHYFLLLSTFDGIGYY